MRILPARRRHTDLSCSEVKSPLQTPRCSLLSSSWTRPSAVALPGRRSSLTCFHRHATQRRRGRQRFVAGTLQMHLNFERRLRRRGRVSALYPGNVSRSLRATLKRLFTADRSTSAPSCFMDPEIVEFVSRVSVSVAAPCR